MPVMHALPPLAAQVQHPHAGVGATLLVLAAVTAGFAGLLVRLKRSSSLLSELATLTAVLLVAGLVLLTRTRTCPASGCGTPAALPAGTAAATALPTPVTPTAALPTTVAAAPEAAPSPVALAPSSGAPATRPTTGVRRSPAAAPAPAAARPSAAPTFTATVIRPASCTSSKGGSVDREAVVLLRNSARSAVTWHGRARETLTGRTTPWAVLDPTGTTIAAGGTVNVGVRPDASLCRNGGPQVVRHVDLTYGRSTLAVELTVYPA